MNWHNMEASNGFNMNYYDSNSNFFSKIHEDSISELVNIFEDR